MSANLAILNQAKKQSGNTVVIPEYEYNSDDHIVITTTPSNMYKDTYSSTTLHDIFNDGSCLATYTMNGNANDLGGTYDGNPVNISYTKGKFYGSRASNFDGTSYISLPDNLITDTSTFSVSFWVKSSATKGMVMAFMVNDGDTNSNSLSFSINGANWRANTANTAGNSYSVDSGVSVFSEFTHICIVLEPALITLYMGGEYIGETITTGTRPVFHLDSDIGGNVVGGWLLNGQVDQFRIFNKGLSLTEVQVLTQEKIIRKTSVNTADIFGDSSIVAHYMFDGNMNDETGNYDSAITTITYNTNGKFGTCFTTNGTGSEYAHFTVAPRSLDVKTISIWVRRVTVVTDDLMILYYNHDESDSTWGSFEDFVLYITLNEDGLVLLKAIGNDNNSGTGLDGGTGSAGNNGLGYTKSLNIDPYEFNHFIIETDGQYYGKLWVNTEYIGESHLARDVVTSRNDYIEFGWYRRYGITGSGYYDYWTNNEHSQFRIFNRALTHKEVLDLYNEKPEYKAVIQR